MAVLRVGMVGVNARGNGWAFEGHVPAVRATSGLQLVAVASRHQDDATRTASIVGADRAYDDPQRLIDDPDVDVVAVVSPVPTHERWIDAAFAARKHVLTEWPVAPAVDTAERLAAAAQRAGVKTAVDLQAGMSTAAARASGLIEDGAIGRVLGVTVLSTTAAFGAVIPAAAAALELPATGMNLRTIQTAHTIDLVQRVVAPIAELQALGAVQWPVVHLGDAASDETVRRTLPDRILVQGVLADGATLSLQVVGGRPADDAPFVMEVTGTDGSIRLHGGGPRGFQAAAIGLDRDGAALDLRDRGAEDVPEAAQNVAGVYRALRDDVLTGSSTAPSFADAADLAHLMARVEEAFATGRRTTVESGAAARGTRGPVRGPG